MLQVPRRSHTPELPDQREQHPGLAFELIGHQQLQCAAAATSGARERSGWTTSRTISFIQSGISLSIFVLVGPGWRHETLTEGRSPRTEIRRANSAAKTSLA